ncbi:MAG TPA: S24 family peptidase [Dongiaceae bacterium]|jgi:phage repressor protein C with HTH and peptisase S24 domain|nr:S24 family peptidase [Dongiaceae bacterium]
MPDSTDRSSSQRLRQAMQLRGIGSGAELARLTHRNEVTVRSNVNGTRDVSKRAAEAYSRALGIDPAWLLYGHGADPTASNEPPVPFDRTPSASGEEDVDGPSNVRLSSSEAPDFRFLSKDIPVLGAAECGSDGVFILNEGGPIDFVRRPPGQMNRKGIYCIYAEGSSMEPVYEAGDLIYVDPHRPPKAGRDVVIQLVAKQPSGEERCFLKRLVRRSGGKWHLKQFNPEKEFVLDEKDVAAVHLVLKNHELMGV